MNILLCNKPKVLYLALNSKYTQLSHHYVSDWGREIQSDKVRTWLNSIKYKPPSKGNLSRLIHVIQVWIAKVLIESASRSILWMLMNNKYKFNISCVIKLETGRF